MAIKPIIAKSTGSGDFEVAPEGVYLARCYKMIDVGTQTSTGMYGTKEARTVYLFWELLEDADGEKVTMADGKPFSIFNSYTLSMHPKATLRKHLDSWRGKKFTEEEAANFDITNLLDKFCLIQVVHNQSKDGTKTYTNIDAIMTTKKTAPGVNPIVGFTVSDPDMEVFNDLPDWLKTKISQAPEFEMTDADQIEEAAAPAKDNDKIDISEIPF